MVKLKRTINSFWRFLVLFSLLITCCDVSAFFNKSEWLPLSKEEADFWSQMSQDFAIECDETNPYVQKQIHWYQQHPKHLQRILKKAEPFIHYVFEQTHRKNLPAELALIPLLESQYNPGIGAASGAAGLWQMMPGTATKFGLKINHTYDGRRDVTASTKAALNYLAYLHRYFNKDWLLALAAYDAGEGKVLSVARRHPNFWELPLSKETREYVPKLLAIAHIIKQRENYNFSLPRIANQPSLQEMTWNEANIINVSEAAKNLGIDDKTFRHFNPAFRKNIANVPHNITFLIPGDGKTPASFVYQSDTKSTINEDNTSDNDQVDIEQPKKVLTYTIKRHDTLISIAKKFNIAVSDLKAINQLKSNKLRVGKEIKISLADPRIAISSTNKKDDKIRRTQNNRYKIHPGDTLSTIAKKYHISVKDLKKTNHLKNERQLKIGTLLTIPT